MNLEYTLPYSYIVFLEKLEYLMDKNGLNKSTLSKACGIPYTTIDGWYKKGYEGLKLTTLRKLASFFNTSLDFWANDNITPYNTYDNAKDKKEAPPLPKELSAEELDEVMLDIRAMVPEDARALCRLIHTAYRRQEILDRPKEDNPWTLREVLRAASEAQQDFQSNS